MADSSGWSGSSTRTGKSRGLHSRSSSSNSTSLLLQQQQPHPDVKPIARTGGMLCSQCNTCLNRSGNSSSPSSNSRRAAQPVLQMILPEVVPKMMGPVTLLLLLLVLCPRQEDPDLWRLCNALSRQQGWHMQCQVILGACRSSSSSRKA